MTWQAWEVVIVFISPLAQASARRCTRGSSTGGMCRSGRCRGERWDGSGLRRAARALDRARHSPLWAFDLPPPVARGLWLQPLAKRDGRARRAVDNFVPLEKDLCTRQAEYSGKGRRGPARLAPRRRSAIRLTTRSVELGAPNRQAPQRCSWAVPVRASALHVREI